VAFCGKSGSGKSTLSFAMQEVGYWQFADDALLLRIEQDRIIAPQLPFVPRLRPALCEANRQAKSDAPARTAKRRPATARHAHRHSAMSKAAPPPARHLPISWSMVTRKPPIRSKPLRG
jgi:hypothetical protein